MKKNLFVLCLSVCFMVTSTAFAGKVVVIPLGGAKNYMYWQGDWSVGVEYKIGDGVQSGGSSFVCVDAHTSSAVNIPPSAAWDLLASKGADGSSELTEGSVNSSTILDSSIATVDISNELYSQFVHVSGGTISGSLIINGALYVGDNVSALSFTDRTPYPKDLSTAYEAILSMQRLPDGTYDVMDKENQLDHSKLHEFVRSPDGEHRDLSATVSAQNEVIKDLIKRIEQLETRIEIQD